MTQMEEDGGVPRASSQELSGAGLATAVCYDCYGTQMATSSEQGIMIWQKSDVSGGWTRSAVLQGEGTKRCCSLTWGHPEYGNVIAVCSMDSEKRGGRVCVWEEVKPATSGEKSEWALRTTLGEWDAAVVEVRFSPPAKGLWLAAGAADGTVRLYECLGALELKHWELQSYFTVAKECVVQGMEWCPSPSGPAVLAVACAGGSGNKVQLWAYMEPFARWSLAASLPCTAAVAAVAWSPMRVADREMLAGACGANVILWRLVVEPVAEDGSTAVHFEELAQLPHSAPVCQMEWNMTASTLATSTADGRVTLWSANLATGEWQPQAVVVGE
mmetsp:Transcript_4896/g.10000  ORF Transcript_4896/g.10000 Transcript_4896/m.10000 type:complete len:329 (-) Transcript_4896:367-1353(-)|eukprot:CAMPEP_0118954770 /NCGR_PEP_ID=MMETSP1169-20130426/58846_1 /TAXON_ID=36882 /ORGANISM="Pyramimonas obovata, Strain CCMP722" /LENGTH=328 /DNA_ID=CAMNT_0006902457 /DNA_START=102 /DNA_END=1088 /DNA_ORIENTATION=-